jgi:hypothetical protein
VDVDPGIIARQAVEVAQVLVVDVPLHLDGDLGGGQATDLPTRARDGGGGHEGGGHASGEDEHPTPDPPHGLEAAKVGGAAGPGEGGEGQGVEGERRPLFAAFAEGVQGPKQAVQGRPVSAQGGDGVGQGGHVVGRELQLRDQPLLALLHPLQTGLES